MKVIGIVLAVFGVLLLIFSIVRYNSAMAVFATFAGASDAVAMKSAFVGVLATVIGILMFMAPIELPFDLSGLSAGSPIIYCLLRLIAGLLFASHGAQKIFGMFDGRVAEAPMMQFGGWVELVGGLLIALGLLTRPAAFLSSGMMAAAYFMAHAGGGWHPVMNKGELAVVYCFLFLYMFFYGPGRFSVDRMIWKDRGVTRD